MRISTLSFCHLPSPVCRVTTLALASLCTVQARSATLPTTTTLTVTSGGSAITSVSEKSVVVLTVIVSSGSTRVPSGQVKFFDGSKEIGFSNVLINKPSIYPLFPDPAGVHSLKAVFTGTDNYATSTSATINITSWRPCQGSGIFCKYPKEHRAQLCPDGESSLQEEKIICLSGPHKGKGWDIWCHREGDSKCNISERDACDSHALTQWTDADHCTKPEGNPNWVPDGTYMLPKLN
jgi:Bacterial Ig-like domain (group 3)